jgi:hypothetical protein
MDDDPHSNWEGQLPVINYPLEELIPIRAIVNRLPLQEDGQPVHPSTVTRWALYGLRGNTLASIKLAGRRYVRKADLEQFLERCAGL